MKKFLHFSLFALWGGAIVASLVALERYANTASAVVPTDVGWPAGTALRLHPELPTALIFAHPKCPCTQASLQEFQRIEGRHPGAFQTVALFTVPLEDTGDWEETRLVSMARHIQSAELMFDRGGAEAARFQARASGQVLLYAPGGRLLFSGGVTSGRGHEGNNGGQEAFEHLLEHPDSDPKTFPVFGCALVRSDIELSEPTAAS